ncbi:MAG: hypothetical protein QOH81_153 [Sphingomonadales bacterium]|nr:hypothetical protein [Sphingomonadales bacterium]
MTANPLRNREVRVMNRLFPSLAAALLLAGAPGQAAPRLTPEARLARELAGKVAGPPVDCIELRDIRSTQIIDRTAILYDTGSTIYVNRPRSGLQSLTAWQTLVTDTHSSQLCSIDVVTLYDSGARMRTGFVFLGRFVPYRTPR